MMAVLGIMAVTLVIGATVSAATINALGFTSATKASVQSRAAAEAGIDVALVGLQNSGSCATANAIYASTAVPAYRATVEYDAGVGWVVGCPPATATRVRILSTGTAQAPGVAGASSGDSQIVEAIYNYIPDYVQVPIIDAAVYAHNITGVLKNFNLTSENNIAATVQIRNGNANCLNGAKIAGDLVLGNGYANLSNCEVTGSIHVSDYVVVNGGSLVRGDVLAAGVKKETVTDDVIRVASGSTVNGSLFAGGNASVNSSSGSTVKKNVTVAGSTLSRATVSTGSEVEGNVISSGPVSRPGSVLGTVSSGVTGLQAPPVPVIPNWVDIPTPSPFASSSWAAEGFQEVLWTGPCVVDHGNAAWTALSTYGTKTVVNALGCASGLSTTSTVDDLSLRANIAVFARSFNFNKLYAESSDATTLRTLSFIVPDDNPDQIPSCVSPGGIYLHNEANIRPSISVLAYSPCKIQSDRDGWRGQIYAGEVEFGQQAKLTFVPVPVPGVSFSGPPVMQLNASHLGNRVSLRDRSSVG